MFDKLLLIVSLCLFQSATVLSQEREIIIAPPETENSIPNTQHTNPDHNHLPPNIMSDTTLYASENRLAGDSVTKWKSEQQFDYMKGIDSILRHDQNERDRKQHSYLNHSSSNSRNSDFIPGQREIDIPVILKYALWGLAALILLFILYKTFFSNISFIKDKHKSQVDINEGPLDDLPDQLSADGYLHRIKMAEDMKDYRLAIRYHFLYLLQRMSDQNLIVFSKEKTNAAYVREVDQTYRNAFSNFVRIYDYSWYGKVPVSEQRYHEIAEQFKQFIH